MILQLHFYSMAQPRFYNYNSFMSTTSSKRDQSGLKDVVLIGRFGQGDYITGLFTHSLVER